ncbi:MAG: ABC transporter substrate-binding protein, partial [Pseudomonadota bacterium]
YDRVVAISKDAWYSWRNLQWNAYAATTPRIEALVDVGEVDGGTFSLEAALAAEPDVAIIPEWQYSALGDAVATLEAAGVPVVVADYNAQTVEKHVASTLLIGEVMGAEKRAKTLADEYAAAVADVEARVAATGGASKRVYVELGNRGPSEYGNTYTDYMWGAVIAMAGGDNIANGQVGKWAPLSPEYVLAADPEVVLIAGSGWKNRDEAVFMGPGVDPATTHARIAPYLDRPGWADIDAVKAGEVHAVYHGGSRTLYDYAYLQYIAKVLYPEAFADIDPEATLTRFFDEYLPIDAAGAYMTQLPK